MEDVSTRSDHIQSSGQHKRSTGASNIAIIASLDDWNFQILHANGTIERSLAFALVFELLLLERVATAGGVSTRD